MCTDGFCFVLEISSQVLLGIVIYRIIKKAGFSTKAARWAYLIPAVYTLDLMVKVMEIDNGGMFGGPKSLGLPFDIFGYIAPFISTIVLAILLASDWPQLTKIEPTHTNSGEGQKMRSDAFSNE